MLEITDCFTKPDELKVTKLPDFAERKLHLLHSPAGWHYITVWFYMRIRKQWKKIRLFCVFLRDVTSDDVIVELQMKDKNMSNLQQNLKAVQSLFINTQYVSSFFDRPSQYLKCSNYRSLITSISEWTKIANTWNLI